jgi:hypothetical protein
MSAQGTGISFDPARADNRAAHIKLKSGELVGANYRVPNGDFARVLGLKAPTSDEESGRSPVTADRVLEMALHKQFNELAPGAMARGAALRNMYISPYPYEQRPGREKDMLKDGLDAIQSSVELNRASNMYYLEMQYKFEMASKNFGMISNLMKVRNDSTKKAISEVR